MRGLSDNAPGRVGAMWWRQFGPIYPWVMSLEDLSVFHSRCDNDRIILGLSGDCSLVAKCS